MEVYRCPGAIFKKVRTDEACSVLRVGFPFLMRMSMYVSLLLSSRVRSARKRRGGGFSCAFGYHLQGG